jgi:toxin ParE1/3/4
VKPVVFHRAARAELDEAVGYYEEQCGGLGLDLQDKIEHAVAMIQRHPQTWPHHGRTKFRKYLLERFPYVVFYWDRPDAIWIMAVAHAKRRPNYWANRVASGG